MTGVWIAHSVSQKKDRPKWTCPVKLLQMIMSNRKILLLISSAGHQMKIFVICYKNLHLVVASRIATL